MVKLLEAAESQLGLAGMLSTLGLSRKPGTTSQKTASATVDSSPAAAPGTLMTAGLPAMGDGD